jgi:hypothetical protein
MMGRGIAVLYGVVCYAIFFLTFLYLVGFLSNLLVPRSIDVGPAARYYLSEYRLLMSANGELAAFTLIFSYRNDRPVRV